MMHFSFVNFVEFAAMDSLDLQIPVYLASKEKRKLEKPESPTKLKNFRKKKPVPNSYDWDQHFSALQHYELLHRTCNVPNDGNLYECFLPNPLEANGVVHYVGYLGSWLQKQRRSFLNKDGTLGPNQAAALQQLINQSMSTTLANSSINSSY
jgi:hypothetical protein